MAGEGGARSTEGIELSRALATLVIRICGAQVTEVGEMLGVQSLAREEETIYDVVSCRSFIGRNNLRIQADKQTCDSGEALFEHALKRISVQAFDVLLACGVRDLAGFLLLTAEGLRQAGSSSRITTELMRIQQQLFEQMKSDRQNDETSVIDSIMGKQQEPCDEVVADVPVLKMPATPIPHNLVERISTRARNVLIREDILSCERLLELQEKDLFNFAGIGRKTVHDIKRLQGKIVQIHPELCQESVKSAQNNRLKSDERPSLPKLATCARRCNEHRASDPPAWSLLSRTLPEVFQVSLPWCNPSIESEQLPISSLGIFSDDIDKLRKIVLFPEDPIELLLSITTGYLLQAGIGDATLLIILNHLARISGFSDHSYLFVSTANVSDTAIFADIQISSFEDFRLPQRPYSNSLLRTEERSSALTWGDLASISERSVVERLGFTVQGLSTIYHLWQLKDQAFKIQNAILKGLPAKTYCSFEQLMDAFAQTVVRNGRESSVLKGRLGLLDGRKWTLEELGQREHLTRERIRQIEKKLLLVLKKPKVLEQLNFLWLAVDETLTSGGGVCCVTEIAESLRNRWKWTALPPDEGLASLISLSANYEVVWAPPIRIIMPTHKCVNCTEIRAVVTRAVESQANGTLLFEGANAIMHGFCQGQTCEKSPEILKFTNGYLHFLDDAIEEILADDTALYTQYAWGIKYGMRRTALVEKIVHEAGRPMHFKEVHAEVNKDRPAHGQLSDRSIYGNLERSPSLLLWGPGTFMHRDLVTIPEALIAEIENDVILRLKTHNIPYLSITGVFEEYKAPLLAKHIPNAHALYSCMRITNNHELDCPDYPYVLRRRSGVQRLPIPLVLETFVLEQEGVVTLDQIKSFAIEKMCVNEAVFMINHLPSIPNLLRVNSGEYVHIRQLGIEKDQLASIMDHLRKLLQNYDHVSARKVFDDKKITCKLLGISTPMLLFSLTQFFYSDQFDLSRYPQIRFFGVETDENRTAGVALEVINYIREKACPCSFVELYQHFVEELGYKQASVHNVLYTYKNILRYSEGVIVHLESLAWTEEKQEDLEKLAASHLDSREIIGKPFGLISYLYEYTHDQLPELPDHVAWTATLIGELLSREGRYTIVGTPRDAYVSVPNSHDIETLDDLLYFILCAEYDGAANIDHFISDMRDAGILKKSLTPMMLGEDSRVVIDGNVVRLARLSDRAERA